MVHLYEVESVKIVVAAIGATLLAIGCSACGVSTGGGFVAGTTGFLQEFNQGRRSAPPQHESITQRDREQLAGLIERRAGR